MIDGRDFDDQPLGELVTGHDLGLAARGKLAKSSLAILDLAKVIHKAYDLYYAPICFRGRPTVNERDAKEAEQRKQWAAFLAASGFSMPQHAKLLRNYWRIGGKEKVLRRNSENLPNSVDALAELCSIDCEYTKEQDLFFMVLSVLTQSSTADDVRFCIKAAKTPTDPLDDIIGIPEIVEQLGNGSHEDVNRCITALKNQEWKQREGAKPIRERQLKEAIAKRNFGNSVCVVSPLPAVEVTKENMVSVAIAILAGKQLGLRKASTESEIKEEFGGQFLAIYQMLERDKGYESFFVSTLDRMRRHGEFAVKAMELDVQAKLIEQEQQAA